MCWFVIIRRSHVTEKPFLWKSHAKLILADKDLTEEGPNKNYRPHSYHLPMFPNSLDTVRVKFFSSARDTNREPASSCMTPWGLSLALILIVAVVLPGMRLAWPVDAMSKVWILLSWTTNTSCVSGVESLRTVRIMFLYVSPCKWWETKDVFEN